MRFDLANQWLVEPFNAFEKVVAEKEERLKRTTNGVDRFFLYKDLAEDELILMLFESSDAMEVFNDYLYGAHGLITKINPDTFMESFKEYFGMVYDSRVYSNAVDIYYGMDRLMKYTLDEFTD